MDNEKYEIDGLDRNNVRMVGGRNVACRYTAGPCRPVEEDGSRLWLPVIRPVEGAEVEITYKGKVSPTIAIAIAELKNAWKGEPVLLEKKRTGRGDGFAITSSEHQVRILSSTETGLLYGVYSLLRMQAAGQLTVPLSVTEQSVYDLAYLESLG